MNAATSLTANREAPHPRRPRVWLRLILVLALVGLVGGGLIAMHRFKSGILKQVSASIIAQLPTVATAKASLRDWQPQLNATGTLRAINGADLSAEVSGIVDELHFESGDEVAAGTLLLRLRPNDDDAKLQQLQATADLDNITYQRDLKQLSAQGVSQATVDTDAGTLRSARAQVAAQQAVMAEKFVRAPFAGKLGLRQVDLGQYLSAGTKIVTLQSLDPIYIDFYVPQQTLGQIHPGSPVTVRADGLSGQSFPGEVTAINAQADSSSRMVQIRATLKNPDHALLPGMYATATVASGAPQKLITIPQSAVSYNPYGSLVYLLRPDGVDAGGKPKLIAKQQFVTTGAARGDQVAILKGIAEGDTVVTAGQIKLRNDVAVLVDDKVQPTNDANPAPIDQ
ncbi:MAG TPA: efflux RND transporter periplasmic adaptor subunit [Stellaceae bacterium]|nr:efflux RND transporter periplasmic adaptor subunit [Stellaceae bacterium]